MGRTVEQKTSEIEGFAKAGELIEIRGTGNLTLQDRRVLNLLYAHAGDRIAEDVTHTIALADLRGSHVGNDRVKDSIKRLIKTVVEIPVSDRRGRPATRMFPLLDDTTICDDEDDPMAEVAYSFSKGVRVIIGRSEYWGRIQSQILFQFSSKYALALYELLCLRRNLTMNIETIEVDRFRSLLGVLDSEYDRTPDLLRRVIEPAVTEVTGLSDLKVSILPLRRGGKKRGKVTSFLIRWHTKTTREMTATMREWEKARSGRKARLSGTIDKVVND